MKRIRIAGLCLVAVFALAAVAASAASASPEYGRCVAQKHGKYSDGACTVLDEKKGKPKGSKEWVPGPAPTCVPQKHGFYSDSGCTTLDEKKGKGKGGFEKAGGPGYTSTGGLGVLETPSFGGPVVCQTQTGVGSVTGATTDLDQVTFSECETNGKKCNSAGEGVGVIKTLALETELTEPVPGEVNTKFQAVGGAANFQAEFDCEGLLVRTKGYVSGTTTPTNVMTTTETAKFGVGKGEQALLTEISINGGVSWLGPAPSTETTEGTVTNNSVTEIRA